MINRNAEYWNGCLPSMKMSLRSGNPDRPDAPLKQYIGDCVPTYNQRGESCVGEGWANWLEIVLRHYLGHAVIPKGHQLDGYKVWWQAKQMFNGGCLAGGLLIPQGFEAMKALGWIPRDSMLVQIGRDWVSQGEALMETPLVVGHMIYDGWFNPNPVNGCLDNVYSAKGKGGGHLTCRVGRFIQKNMKFYADQNSWGQYYAWNGIYLIEEETSHDTMLDFPHTIAIPGGFARLRDLEGWKAGLISTPGDQQQIRF
jgi:hypothetical protein